MLPTAVLATVAPFCTKYRVSRSSTDADLNISQLVQVLVTIDLMDNAGPDKHCDLIEDMCARYREIEQRRALHLDLSGLIFSPYGIRAERTEKRHSHKDPE